MKLNIKIVRNETTYESLEPGEIFYYGSKYYLLLDESEYNEHNDEVRPQAIDLEKYELIDFANNTFVRPCKARLEINN